MSTAGDLPGQRMTPRSESAWRRWLEANHAGCSAVWVVFYKVAARRRGRPTLTYASAVEQAICFGWIDGLKIRVDDERYAHRFTPRKAGSRWSETNRARLEAMRRLGRMTPAGEAAVAAAIRSGAWEKSASSAPGEVPTELVAALDDDPAAHGGWEGLAPSERRRYAVWVGMAKRPDTRARRLAESLERLRRGERLGMR